MSKRLHEIDGIRGWAALAVVLFHLVCETFGQLVPIFHSAFTKVFFNGGLAVAIFFVLSGDALSAGFLRSKNLTSLDSVLIKRYFRLTIPILLSCSLVYLLMKMGLTFNARAAEIVHRKDWLGAFIAFEPNLTYLLRYSLYIVYDGGNGGNSYNPFLWTMNIEMVGSILIIVYLYVSERLRKPKAVLYFIILFLLSFNSFYALFFAGLLFGRYRIEGLLDKFRASFKWKIVSALILIFSALVLAFGGKLTRYPFDMRLTIAIAIVFCAYTSNGAIAFFSSKASRFLGSISFPLYLVHFGVIVSFTSYCINISAGASALDLHRILLIISSSVAVSITIAVMFRYLENLALKVIDVLPALILNSPAAKPVQRAEGIVLPIS